MKMSKQEFMIGSLAPLPMAVLIGWWVLILCAITSILWPLGGTYSKVYRRVLIPLICGIIGAILSNWFMAIVSFNLGFLCLSLGDGFSDQLTGDEGSWLGRQVAKLGLETELSGLITKLIILPLFWLTLIPMLIRN